MAAKARSALLALAILGMGVLTIALLSGLFYEQGQRARDRLQFPPQGRAIDIGGRVLRLDCEGAGRPAVILARGAPWTFYFNPKDMFEHGAPRPGYGWVAIQRELANITEVCWYDRAGAGWSDLGPYPRDSASQARDLHAVLERAGIRPPYLLVAESSAALDTHVYASFYPAEAAGLVWINGVHPDLLLATRPGTKRLARLPGFVGYSQDAMAQLFNLVGLYRLGRQNRPQPPPTPEGMTSAEWSTVWQLTQSSKARAALMQDIASWQTGAAEARAAGSLGDRPLWVLSSRLPTAAPEDQGTWTELQTDLARLSTAGRIIAIDARSADLIYDAPRPIVDTIRQALVQLRRP